MEILIGWVQDKVSIQQAYETEQKIVLELIDRCLEKSVDAVILADDLSGEKAPFINPQDLDEMCSPFYSKAISSIRTAGSMVFFHCCGNLIQLIPLIKSWRIDGFAAIQISKNDISLLDRELGGIYLAGIEATLLEQKPPFLNELETLKQFVVQFVRQDRLVLCSSCGLYKADFLERVKQIYEMLENTVE